MQIIDKSSGKIVKKNPRCIGKNVGANVEITLNKRICIEKFDEYRELGRFTLRIDSHSIAAGIVMDLE